MTTTIIKRLKATGSFLVKNKYKTIIGIVVLILVCVILGRRGGGAKFEVATAAVSNVVETVSVTGTVSPISKADISFQKSGVIAHLYAAVGDQIKAGDRIASLASESDAANYESALATLADMSRSLRPEETTVEKAKVSVAETALAAAKKDAVNATRDAYAKVQAAIVNYVYGLFSDPTSPNPIFNVPVDSYAKKNALQAELVAANQTLSEWLADLPSDSSQDPTAALSRSEDRLASLKSFVKDIATIVGNLTTANSGFSQTTITGFVASLNSAVGAVSQVTDSLTAADSALHTASVNLEQANSNYTLRVAGNSSDAIAAQRAKVDQAAAELAKDTIISPIDGLVTKITPNEGEFVAAGSSGFAVQSIGSYKIEAFVPEADIAKVAIGDVSSTTLDAYGSDTYFMAKVVAIDPAETVIEGVPTYKVTLYFIAKDDRIRSGMTANLDILTHERDNVLAIPYRAVVNDNGMKTVRISNAAKTAFTSVPVVTGLKGSDGLIEIVSGISAGDTVVTYVQ